MYKAIHTLFQVTQFYGTIYVRATKNDNTSIYKDFGLEFDLPAGQKSDRSYNTADFSNEGNISLEEGNYTLSYHLPQGTIRYEETDSTTITVRYCQDTPVDITVGASGFSTVILPYEVFPIPNGLNVYNITGITDEELTLEVDNLMHANTPYFIQGAAGQHYENDEYGKALYAPLIPEDFKPTTLFTSGLLNGYVRLPGANATCPTGSYVLQTLDGRCAFYKVTEEKPISLVAGKCYLQLPTSSEAKQINFPNLDETNSISSIESSLSDIVAIYDLSGKPQTALIKGHNIVKHSNGKMTKILVR